MLLDDLDRSQHTIIEVSVFFMLRVYVVFTDPCVVFCDVARVCVSNETVAIIVRFPGENKK